MRPKKIFTYLIIAVLIALLLYTRLVGINWGLPFPFHPDERNMADVITRLQCDLRHDPINCFEPGFYAYGQLTIYIGYVIALILHAVSASSSPLLTYSEAVLGLRIQSVLWSLATVGLMLKMLFQFLMPKFIRSHRDKFIVLITALLLFTFQSYAIEFAHFGTTESALMFLYLAIAYLSMRLYEEYTVARVVHIGLVLGLSSGVKVSSVIYVFLPLSVLMYRIFSHNHELLKICIKTYTRSVCLLGVSGFVGMIIASPHMFLHVEKVIPALSYEIQLGSPLMKVFYTRQFEYTLPVLFQFVAVFPYVLGVPAMLLFGISFIFLAWKNSYFNILRAGIILYGLPVIFLYLKWGRFMTPLLPLMSLTIMVGLLQLYVHFGKNVIARIALIVIFISLLIHGAAYLSIYTHQDTRLEASRWMYENLPTSSNVLTEFGNVMTLPIAHTSTRSDANSNDFARAEVNLYEVDANKSQAIALRHELENSKYVVIASRRVFANFTCIWPADSIDGTTRIAYAPIGTTRDRCEKKEAEFPLVSDFYAQLTDPNQFTLIKTFTSYPRITFRGKTLIEFPDEHAEEALTVFDHPVVRIYEKL